MIDTRSITALRMRRQHLLEKADEKDYERLFRDVSPVQTVYWCRPGDPPQLPFRADFNDYDYCYRRRSRREIVKGRFQNGGVAYVFADDLALYGAAYRKDAQRLSFEEAKILELLRREGPMTIGLMKEFSGLLVKQITPLLHRLQEKFLLFEDQTDNEWDRAWYLFEDEFPTVDFRQYSRSEAIRTILLRFACRNVWIEPRSAQSFFRFPHREIEQALSTLKDERRLLPFENGYIPASDEPVLRRADVAAPSGVFALHRNDFLVKSNEYRLKDRYPRGPYDIRHYLLIDGEFHGAVLGHFKFTDVPLEDVVLDLPAEEAERRKEEILAAVGKVTDLTRCPLKRFMGKEQ